MQATSTTRLATLDLRTQVLALLGVIVVLGGFFAATALLGWDFGRATVLIGAGIAFAVTLRWRWGILAVLVYVTVEGLVGNLLYPETYPVLLKDALIAGAYVGFGTSLLVRQERWLVPRWIVYPYVALVALCIVESFNPRGYDPLVALVGFRVLVFYVPLFVLGFHLVRSGLDTDRLAMFLLIASIPITAFGIAEYVAGADAVSSLGPGFARSIWIVGPEATSDVIFRPASTFAFVGHFGSYLLFLGVVGFAALHAPATLLGRVVLTVAFALAGIAIVLQAQRTTWVLMPVAIILIYVLNRQLRGASRAVPIVLIAIALVATIGAPVLENRLPGLTSGVDPFANRLSPVLAGFAANTSIGDILIGHGTGTALGAARYVTGGQVPDAFESAWYSPYYMFGIWGLLAYVWLYLAVLRAAWHGVRSLPKQRRWISSGLFAFLLVEAVIFTPINYPPTNVLFWVFAGMLAGQGVGAHTGERASDQGAEIHQAAGGT
jgi:hypothetical protein